MFLDCRMKLEEPRTGRTCIYMLRIHHFCANPAASEIVPPQKNPHGGSEWLLLCDILVLRLPKAVSDNQRLCSLLIAVHYFPPHQNPTMLESSGGKCTVQEDQQHSEEVVSTWWFRASSSGTVACWALNVPLNAFTAWWRWGWHLEGSALPWLRQNPVRYVYVFFWFFSECRSDIPSLTLRSRNAAVVTLQRLGESRLWSTAQPHSSSGESTALPSGSGTGGNQKPSVICEDWECLTSVDPKKALGRQRVDVLTTKFLYVISPRERGIRA